MTNNEKGMIEDAAIQKAISGDTAPRVTVDGNDDEVHLCVECEHSCEGTYCGWNTFFCLWGAKESVNLVSGEKEFKGYILCDTKRETMDGKTCHDYKAKTQ